MNRRMRRTESRSCRVSCGCYRASYLNGRSEQIRRDEQTIWPREDLPIAGAVDFHSDSVYPGGIMGQLWRRRSTMEERRNCCADGINRKPKDSCQSVGGAEVGLATAGAGRRDLTVLARRL